MDLRLTAPAPPDGHVTFLFHAGPRDGQSTSASSPFAEGSISEATLFWFQTNGGRVFPALSPGFLEALETAERYTATDGSQIVAGLAAGQLHLYKVVEQEQTSAGVKVMCDYVGIGPADTPLSAIPPDAAP